MPKINDLDAIATLDGTENFAVSTTTASPKTFKASVDKIEAFIDHTQIQNIGTNTHVQIDNHIADMSNPHNVTLNQVSILNTKGDIIVYDGSNNIRLPVGADGEVLKANSATTEGIEWTTDVGQNNTASNVGVGGVGLFKQKTGVDLEFNNINAGSSKITVALDAGNNEVDIDVSEANLTLDNIGGTLSINKGGTGQTTQVAAFDALAPTTTKGDVIAHNGTDNIRLPVGTDGQFLSANSAQVSGLEWVDTVTSIGTFRSTVAQATSAARAPWPTNAAGTNGTAYFSAEIPSDFSSLSKLEIRYIAGATAAGLDIDLTLNYGDGESYLANSNTDTTSTYSVTVDLLNTFDISALFTGVAAGDTIGVSIDHNAIGQTIYYIGLFGEYVRA